LEFDNVVPAIAESQIKLRNPGAAAAAAATQFRKLDFALAFQLGLGNLGFNVFTPRCNWYTLGCRMEVITLGFHVKNEIL